MLFNWKLFPGTNLQDLNLDWIINFVKMIPSRLPKFSDHHTWLVYDYSTGEYFDSGEPTGGAGEPGEPGKSPIIGANGNWWTWNTTTEAYTDTGTRAQGVQGEPGAGVAAGGAAGDVLVKASGVDYNTGWTATPPQMGSLAPIEKARQAENNYNKRDFLVYEGQLYYANEDIFAGTDLNPNVNIIPVNMGYFVRRINNFLGVGNTAVNYNIDTLTVVTRDSGIYFYDGYSANLQGTLPFIGANGLLFVADNGNGGCVQIAINITTGKIYRRLYPTAWPNWSESN